MADSFHNLRVTVMGLGTRGGGVGVARYLAEQGALVTVTDTKGADDLATPMQALAGLPIRYVLGGHDESDFTPAGADMVIRNPGVPRRSKFLLIARDAGVPIEMEMSLFFRACPAPIIGITGTKGKTTVSSLSADMLRAWDDRTVLAGNMGVSALAQLPRIEPATPVVIEISSWQVEALAEHGLAPHIAVLTNISEDHLDHYDGFQDYANTKRSITRHQKPSDILIVNADDREASQAATDAAAHVVPFGLRDQLRDGAWFARDNLLWRHQHVEQTFDLPHQPALAGSHGTANALAAIAIALLRGAPPDAVATGLKRFVGVKDRMETVAEIGSVTFINDTTATAPAATIAALESLAARGHRIHLIAGGADKRLDLTALTATIARHAHAVYLLEGSATGVLNDLLSKVGVNASGPFNAMRDVVDRAAAASEPGDVVLLSPGCASFGLFQDEFDRGAQFRATVQALRPDDVGATRRVAYDDATQANPMSTTPRNLVS